MTEEEIIRMAEQAVAEMSDGTYLAASLAATDKDACRMVRPARPSRCSSKTSPGLSVNASAMACSGCTELDAADHIVPGFSVHCISNRATVAAARGSPNAPPLTRRFDLATS